MSYVFLSLIFLSIDDYNYLSDALPPLPEVPDSGSVLSSVDIPARCLRNPAFHHASLRYCSALSMDSSPDSAERPISYSSTSSSASSRDSHCSLGSRSTLVTAPHCNPGTLDRDSGAIRLELVPARQLGCQDEDDRNDGGMDTGRGQGRQGSAQTEHSEPKLGPDAGEQTGQVQGPKTYVDRVVQEILDTERTYVQDLRSIVEVRITQPQLCDIQNLCKKLEAEGSYILAGLQRYINIFGLTWSEEWSLEQMCAFEEYTSSKCDYSVFL